MFSVGDFITAAGIVVVVLYVIDKCKWNFDPESDQLYLIGQRIE